MHIIPTQSPKAFRSICTSDIFFEKAVLVKKSSLNNPPKGIRWIKNSRNVSFTFLMTHVSWTLFRKNTNIELQDRPNFFKLMCLHYPNSLYRDSNRCSCTFDCFQGLVAVTAWCSNLWWQVIRIYNYTAIDDITRRPLLIGEPYFWQCYLKLPSKEPLFNGHGNISTTCQWRKYWMY